MPHPFDRMHTIPDAATLLRHLDQIDIFEVYNSRLLFDASTTTRCGSPRKYNLIQAAGSDAHVLPGHRHRDQPHPRPSTGRRSSCWRCVTTRSCAAPRACCIFRGSNGCKAWPGRAEASGADRRIGRWVTVADDQIYERYQAKAIDEINALGHDIAEWLGEHHRGRRRRCSAPATRWPTSCSSSTGRMPAEVQEGVAFFGRAGQAILKSLQRLRIDPLMLYGTVCLKAAIDPDDDDLEQSRALADPRAAHHAAAHRGHPAARTRARSSTRSRFPLAAPCTGAVGEIGRFTPDHRDAGGARHRPLPRRLRLEAGVLGRVQGARHLVREPAAVLTYPSEAMAQRQIVAMGGGGFLMEGRRVAARRLRARARQPAGSPRVLSRHGDGRRRDRTSSPFTARSRSERADASHLALFQRDERDPRTHLLAQDVIYVGGGNTVNMLAIWRAHGVDARAARGVGGRRRPVRDERRLAVLVRGGRHRLVRAAARRCTTGSGCFPAATARTTTASRARRPTYQPRGRRRPARRASPPTTAAACTSPAPSSPTSSARGRTPAPTGSSTGPKASARRRSPRGSSAHDPKGGRRPGRPGSGQPGRAAPARPGPPRPDRRARARVDPARDAGGGRARAGAHLDAAAASRRRRRPSAVTAALIAVGPRGHTGDAHQARRRHLHRPGARRPAADAGRDGGDRRACRRRRRLQRRRRADPRDRRSPPADARRASRSTCIRRAATASPRSAPATSSSSRSSPPAAVTLGLRMWPHLGGDDRVVRRHDDALATRSTGAAGAAAALARLPGGRTPTCCWGACGGRHDSPERERGTRRLNCRSDWMGSPAAPNAARCCARARRVLRWAPPPAGASQTATGGRHAAGVGDARQPDPARRRERPDGVLGVARLAQHGRPRPHAAGHVRPQQRRRTTAGSRPTQFHAALLARRQRRSRRCARGWRRRASSVVDVPDNRLFVTAAGTIAQVERAFNVNEQPVPHRRHGWCARRTPTRPCPMPLARDVRAITGLDGALALARRPTAHARRPPPPPPGGNVGRAVLALLGRAAPRRLFPNPYAPGTPLPWTHLRLQPAQITSAYGINRLHRFGPGRPRPDDRDHRRVLLAHRCSATPTASRASSTCRRCAALATTARWSAPGTLQYPQDDAETQSWYIEQALDVEWAHAVAPGAQDRLRRRRQRRRRARPGGQRGRRPPPGEHRLEQLGTARVAGRRGRDHWR